MKCSTWTFLVLFVASVAGDEFRVVSAPLFVDGSFKKSWRSGGVYLQTGGIDRKVDRVQRREGAHQIFGNVFRKAWRDVDQKPDDYNGGDTYQKPDVYQGNDINQKTDGYTIVDIYQKYDNVYGKVGTEPPKPDNTYHAINPTYPKNPETYLPPGETGFPKPFQSYWKPDPGSPWPDATSGGSSSREFYERRRQYYSELFDHISWIDYLARQVYFGDVMERWVSRYGTMEGTYMGYPVVPYHILYETRGSYGGRRRPISSASSRMVGQGEYAIRGSTAFLKCSFPSDSVIVSNIVWKARRDGESPQWVGESPQWVGESHLLREPRRYATENRGTESVLAIQSLDPHRDSGVYECHASRKIGRTAKENVFQEIHFYP